MPDPNSHDVLRDVFIGDSQMAAQMRAHDWAATSLGPVAAWPESLKVALRILLTSKFDMWLGWGPDINFFYNDAYTPTLGIKHPAALGEPTRTLWAEIWDDISGRIRTVYEEGQATWDKALLLLLERGGYPEETYHTFSYSPLMGDSGKVEGLFCAVSEDTERVISERRMATLRELVQDLAAAESREAVLAAVDTRLKGNPHDLPFTLTYLFDPDGSARLVGHSGGIGSHDIAVPQQSGRGVWPLAEIEAGHPLVELPLAGLTDLPTGSWDKPPAIAVVTPLWSGRTDSPAGFFVAAINPYRRLDATYVGFVDLVAGQISGSLARAGAFEAERARVAVLADAAKLRAEAAEALAKANRQLAADVAARTAERDRLLRLFQQAPGFLCVLEGPDHILAFMNEAYSQLVGHRDLVGLTIRQALPEVEGQGFFEQLDGVYATGEPFFGRNQPITLQTNPNGAIEERVLDFVYQPITGEDGAVTGIIVEGSDVTEGYAAQRALVELNETLEARVEERTTALRETEEALRQSQKMEAVGQLTGGLAHDFNNLLQGITGSLDLLQNRIAKGRTEGLERFISGAMISANRAASLTHRLLAFSRRQPLDPKPVKVNPLVGSMEDLLRRTTGEHITLEFVMAGGLWPTLCDPNQLESAILNLVINARDAMPGGGKLTIETCNAHLDRAYAAQQREVTPGQYVCIAITDTGTGMSPETLARAFDPFYTTKAIGQGTGLGLSMIYGFARQSEGYCKIYSELGEGTTVKLYLPRHRGEAEDEAHGARLAEIPAAEEGEVVLVVEDEQVVRRLIVEVLSDLGYTAMEAATGPEGLTILEGSGRIDLVVTDIGLPGLNGRQMIEAARLKRPTLKVLFMTGYAENATLANGFLEPGMEMVTKPFAMDALGLQIRTMLERSND